MRSNKRGLVRIIEAFIAVLLVAGVLLFVVSKNNDISGAREEKIEDLQRSVLQEIARNDQFRAKILALNDEMEITSTQPAELTDIWTQIRDRIDKGSSGSLDFRVKVCKLENICALNNYPETDVYSKSIAITSNITDYSPKQLKLWVW